MRAEQGIVIDASAAVAFLVSEPEGPAVGRLLVAWSKAKRGVSVPSFFWLELVNSLLRGLEWPGAEALEAIHKLDVYQLTTVEQDRALVISALDLAERHGMTAYDAAHLALAIRLDAQLLTLDRQLAAAAGERAVPVEDGRISDLRRPYERSVTWPSYREASAYLAKLRAEAIRGT
jgi:predicted nucleic acid-binding protein